MLGRYRWNYTYFLRQVTTLTDNDNFLVLACDGLYDVFTNEEVVSFVKKEMEAHGDCQKCCQVCLCSVLFALVVTDVLWCAEYYE